MGVAPFLQFGPRSVTQDGARVELNMMRSAKRAEQYITMDDRYASDPTSGISMRISNASAYNISRHIALSLALMGVIFAFAVVWGVIVVESTPSNTSHAVKPVTNADAPRLPPSPRSE